MEGYNASEGIEPRNCNCGGGRTLTGEVGNSVYAVLVRGIRRTGVEAHGRPSQGIVRNLGDPTTSAGAVGAASEERSRR